MRPNLETQRNCKETRLAHPRSFWLANVSHFIGSRLRRTLSQKKEREKKKRGGVIGCFKRNTWGCLLISTYIHGILKLQDEKTNQFIYSAQIYTQSDTNQELCLPEDCILTCSISLVFDAMALERLLIWLSSYNSVPSVVFDSGSSVWSINKGAMDPVLKTEEVLCYFLKGHKRIFEIAYVVTNRRLSTKKCCLINFKKRKYIMSWYVKSICMKAGRYDFYFSEFLMRLSLTTF